jgi:hypothetical protein
MKVKLWGRKRNQNFLIRRGGDGRAVGYWPPHGPMLQLCQISSYCIAPFCMATWYAMATSHVLMLIKVKSKEKKKGKRERKRIKYRNSQLCEV